MAGEDRIPIGIWSELGPGARWANEGVSRVVGFLIEGAAVAGTHIFHVLVPRGMRETVLKDLRQLTAVEDRDWKLWEPSTDHDTRFRPEAGVTTPEADIVALAEFANRNVPVKAWIVTFPHFSGSLRLTKPMATLFPDALPYDFPLGWLEGGAWEADGGWPKWRATATEVIAKSRAVITFSKHVAERHAHAICNVPREKIRVVPVAPPDLTPLLPFVKGRCQSPKSRLKAADILRRYAAERKFEYLRSFPFEHVEFVAAATQDRPSKKLGLVAEAVGRIVRETRGTTKLVLTASFHADASWTRLPVAVRQGQLYRDVISLPDIPREVHAALLHCATVVVHTSFFEGIVGALPFYEAASLGTPSVIAQGPHIDELIEEEPALLPYVFNPYDVNQLSRLIREVSSNREKSARAQVDIYESICRRQCWAKVATAFADAALAQDPTSISALAQ